MGHCKMAPIAEINFKYVVKTYPVEQINCQFILILPFSCLTTTPVPRVWPLYVIFTRPLQNEYKLSVKYISIIWTGKYHINKNETYSECS